VNPNNSTDQIWALAPNPSFGAPGAIVPKFGSRSFQFSNALRVLSFGFTPGFNLSDANGKTVLK